jgi:hypothetical protein
MPLLVCLAGSWLVSRDSVKVGRPAGSWAGWSWLAGGSSVRRYVAGEQPGLYWPRRRCKGAITAGGRLNRPGDSGAVQPISPELVLARRRVWPPVRLVIERRGVRELLDVAAVGVGGGYPFLAGSWAGYQLFHEPQLKPRGCDGALARCTC